MLPDYADIRALTDREPDWFTEVGVPRYEEFCPEMLGVYDGYAVLLLIACQSCSRRFEVGIGRPKFEFDGFDRVTRHNLRTLGAIRVGDPPRHGCPGDSMMSSELSVLEAWWKGGPSHNFAWKRDRNHEGLIG